AGRARLRDDLTAAAAGRAGLLDREKSLLHAHRALPAAAVADLRLGARLGARAMAGFAVLPARHADLGRVARGRLLERDLHRVAQVGAAVDVAASAPLRSEDVAEDVAEHVGETAETLRAGETAGIRIHARVPEAVVGLALGRIGKHLVGFLHLLEARLG